MQTVIQAATIANGTAITAAIDLLNGRLVGVQLASWTAANLTFQVSFDGTTFADLFDDGGNEVTVTTGGADRVLLFRSNLVDLFRGAQKIKVRSGTTGVPVNQGAERTLRLFLAPAF